MLYHKVDELSCLRAHLVIHFRGFPHHKIIIAGRHCIAVRKDPFFIVKGQLLHAETLCLSLVKPFTDRHDHSADLFSERFHLFLSVIGASLLHIAHRNIIFIAQVAPHLISYAE